MAMVMVVVIVEGVVVVVAAAVAMAVKSYVHTFSTLLCDGRGGVHGVIGARSIFYHVTAVRPTRVHRVRDPRHQIYCTRDVGRSSICSR